MLTLYLGGVEQEVGRSRSGCQKWSWAYEGGCRREVLQDRKDKAWAGLGWAVGKEWNLIWDVEKQCREGVVA